MSYFEDASLVLIPSAVKISKAYAIKPTDGTGDLTFTRSNDTATRVASNGLIEKVRTNLQTYSQDFSNAVWVKSAGATLTHSQTDPNGGTTASRLQMPSGTSNYFAASAISGLTNGGQYTHSVYMKSNTGSTQSVRILDGVRGVAGGDLTASVTTSWQRFELVITTASTSAGLQIDNVSGTYNNDILIAFAQTEDTDFGATDYIATTTAAVSVGPVANLPRLDYLGGATCPKLLLEPQRTNLATYSEQFNNAAWDKSNITVTANAAISPDGYTNADLLNITSVSNYIDQAGTIVSGSTYTVSCYVKSAVSSSQTFILYGNANKSSSAFTATQEWQRFTHTFTSDSTAMSSGIVSSALVQLYAYGFQLELGAYATSYIPTLGSASTRGSDAASKTGISSLIGQTEGTLFADVNITKLVDNEAIGTINSGGYANNTTFQRLGNNIQFVRNSATQSSASVQTQVIATGRHKMAIAYKSGDTAFFLDGVQVSTTQTETFTNGTLSVLSITGDAIGAIPFSDSYNQTLLFTTRLTNAQLAELTTL
jgi:hypothetical protein